MIKLLNIVFIAKLQALPNLNSTAKEALLYLFLPMGNPTDWLRTCNIVPGDIDT